MPKFNFEIERKSSSTWGRGSGACHGKVYPRICLCTSAATLGTAQSQRQTTLCYTRRMIDIYANDSLARGLRLRLLWQYLYSRKRERAKPLCVPLPILNIYAYKAGILSYNSDRSVELRFKLQTWVGQLNLLVRILLRTSFPLFYVNRYTPIPHTFS